MYVPQFLTTSDPQNPLLLPSSSLYSSIFVFFISSSFLDFSPSLLNLLLRFYILFGLLFLFWTTKSKLMRLFCCLYVYVFASPTTFEWTKCYETWCVHHGIWAYLNGITAYFIKNFLQSLCSYEHPSIVGEQRLGKNITTATKAYATIDELLDSSFPVRFV